MPDIIYQGGFVRLYIRRSSFFFANLLKINKLSLPNLRQIWFRGILSNGRWGIIRRPPRKRI